MALIPCYECYKEISDHAPACPHCGALKDESPFTDSFYSTSFIGWVETLQRWGQRRVDVYGGSHVEDGPYQEFVCPRGEEPRLIRMGVYSDGKKVGLWESYGKNGVLLESVHYYNGEKNGLYLESTSASALVETGTYQDGMKNGPFELTWSAKNANSSGWPLGPGIHDGQLLKRGYYRNGKEHGLVKEYYEGFLPKSECVYVDGQRHGRSVNYLKDGDRVAEGFYNMGEKCGEWRHSYRIWIFKKLKYRRVTYHPCPPDLADGN